MVRTGWIVLVLGLVLLAGCHSAVNGQRVSLRHDEKANEFHILVYNDGIYGIGEKPAESAREVRETLEGGRLFWWSFGPWFETAQLNPRRVMLEEQEADGKRPTSVSPHWEPMCALTDVRTLGHYFDGFGRPGALQHVRIRRFHEFLIFSNALLRDHDHEEIFGRGMPKTLALLRKEAEAGKDWLTVDGHSLVLSIPVDEEEWKRVVVPAFLEGCRPRRGNALSVTVANGRSTVRLGHADRPSTYRMVYNTVMETDLGPQVQESAPVNLDRRRLIGLLAPGGTRLPCLEWGPPEEKVRALLRGLVSEDPDVRAKALERLRAFGIAWNRDGRKPVAPGAAKKLQTEIDAWWGWYRSMIWTRMSPPRGSAHQSKRK